MESSSGFAGGRLLARYCGSFQQQEGDTPDTLIQNSSLEALLTPDYWLEVLTERGLNEPGTVLISGTVAMTHGVHQFARSWKVEMTDPATGSTLDAQYMVEQMAEPIG
ncbi:UNVERIFIED_ORG: hypothetical protein ABIB52_002170 [Arthrobacter sp. UYCu721]